MVNGGSDCCITCVFRRELSEEERPKPWLTFYCTIRNEYIHNPGYTYCINWHTRCNVPQGPIYAYGLYNEGDWRIPWHNKKEPEKLSEGNCFICGTEFKNGLAIDDDCEIRKFCSCRHYVQWWKSRHQNERLHWDCTRDDEGLEWEEIDLQMYDEALKINPKNAHAWFKKGVLLHYLKRYDEVLNCYERILEIDPEKSMAWNNKGWALEKLGSVKEAVKCYKKALEIDPENSNAKNNLRKHGIEI